MGDMSDAWRTNVEGIILMRTADRLLHYGKAASTAVSALETAFEAISEGALNGLRSCC